MGGGGGRQRKEAVTPTCRFSESRLRLLTSNLVSCFNSSSMSLIWEQWRSRHEAGRRDAECRVPDGKADVTIIFI